MRGFSPENFIQEDINISLTFPCITGTPNVTNFFQHVKWPILDFYGASKACNFRIYPTLKDGIVRFGFANGDPCPIC